MDESHRTCPKCGTEQSLKQLEQAGYRCASCGLELAHSETSPNGATRNLHGWLHGPGDLLLDRFRVDKVLGKGGFAATYLVEDTRLNGKRRALKEIPRALYDETETEFLSGLSHPAIPDIIDRYDAGDMVYLVLEFGGGRTLESERKQRGGRIPLRELLPWLHQLGAVLEYLHRQDPPIVHRDLKPENVLLDDLNRVMLIDFGIAKKSIQGGGTTRLIARAATHGFSPPEQVLGTGTDPRSDVYALAATAYALLTGQVPAAAPQRVAGEELVPAESLVPDLPLAAARSLDRGLSLNLNQRPQTVGALLAPFFDVGVTEDQTAPESSITTRTVRIDQLPDSASARSGSVRIRSARVADASHAVPAKGAQTRAAPWGWMAVVGAAILFGGCLTWWVQRGQEPQTVATPKSPALASLTAVDAPPPPRQSSTPLKQPHSLSQIDRFPSQMRGSRRHP